MNTNGSCFYYSVLAIIEDPVIRQGVAFNARNVTSIQDLRLSLANFMEVNTILHGLEQFQMQRDVTLEENKLTWTRYLATIRDPYGWADELVVMCMALFLGKDIMQFSDSAIKTKPWYIIPGQIPGWPFPVTAPPLIMGNCNPWHFEPLCYKPPLNREVACISCGWTGKNLKNHLMRTTKSCKLFYNINKPWTTPNVPAAYSQTPDITTGP